MWSFIMKEELSLTFMMGGPDITKADRIDGDSGHSCLHILARTHSDCVEILGAYGMLKGLENLIPPTAWSIYRMCPQHARQWPSNSYQYLTAVKYSETIQYHLFQHLKACQERIIILSS